MWPRHEKQLLIKTNQQLPKAYLELTSEMACKSHLVKYFFQVHECLIKKKKKNKRRTEIAKNPSPSCGSFNLVCLGLIKKINF